MGPAEGKIEFLEDPEGVPPQTVLIVDDEPDILESLADLLESELPGVRAIGASSGAAALSKLSEERVDLIVTDYRMPGMTGLEFLAKARSVAPTVPRVLITAFPDLDLALRAINEERIENFLTKPVMPRKVVEVVGALLFEQRMQEMRERALAKSLRMLAKNPES